MAEEQLASDADIEEMAGALGFASSHSEGFWEALTEAVAEQREKADAERAAAAEKADADRADQANETILDAANFGRRTEVTYGPVTSFTEFIPPASGDIIDGTTNIRTGIEETRPDGTKKISTNYFKPGSPEKVAVVVSEVKDGVETVTQVVEFVPGSVDAKVGDERPVPPEGSSAAGKKPHTIDPKADGSLGKASGGQPDGGAKIEKTDPPPTQETTASGERVEFDPIELPDGKVITPFVETKPLNAPEDLPHRSGYDLKHPDWDDAVARITAYFDKEGKLAGVVGSVIQNGKETVVAVEEVTPGSLGLKKGDSRPTPDSILKSNQPSTWDPKPKSGTPSGTTTGGTQPTGGSTSPSGTEPKQDPEPTEGERANSGASQDPTSDPSKSGGEQAPASGTGTTSGQTSTSSSGDSHPQYIFHGQGPVTQNADGSTSQRTVYETQDGVRVQTVTTTHKDGSKTEERNCSKDAQKVDCPTGMTDEPTCHSDCARLAMLTELFFCASGGSPAAECGQAPEGLRPGASAAPDCYDEHAMNQISTESDVSAGPTVRVTAGQVDGNAKLDCSNAEKPGGPIDYGDPTDPNGGEPVDPGQYDPNDGVTDPANPGEPEEMVAGSIRLDMYGTLRDPANPPGTEESAPGPGAPDTGEAERRVP